MGGRTIPLAGIALAIMAGTALAFAGTDIWLAAMVVMVWALSFWLTAQPPEPVRSDAPDAMKMTRSGMRDLIEHSGLPQLMLDDNRIIAANAAAREVLGGHIVGQDARVAFRHPAAVDVLSRPDGGSATVQGLTGPRSVWQMSRQPIDARYFLIELVNRSAEVDISRAHTDFVANASHELRTPLSSIIGYVETLVDEADKIEPAQRAKFLGIVLREARRLQSLVEDLMSLSQVEAEKHDPPRERISLGKLVRQSARDGAGPDRQDRISLSIAAQEMQIRGDARQLEQLVRNLVDNALKYGASGSAVTIDLQRGQRDMARLTVQDRGEGIAAHHLPHLTRRFYRTDPGRSRAAGGTGLGLAIVKHIVERHRGRLDIESTPGEGTSVIVRLPLIVED